MSNKTKLIDPSHGLIRKCIKKPYAAGALSDLSFAVKDNIDLANCKTGNGNPCWEETHTKAVANAVCVDQLLTAGANCIGKTQLDELACSLLGMNEFYKNPINTKAPDRITGGSSSGSAAVVASGLVDFALGTDTSGSVRVPASNCGLWGYRPSHGLISTAGVIPMAPSFDTVGVFANNGQVLSKVLQVLLASVNTNSTTNLTINFLDDIFANCDFPIQQIMAPVINEITKVYPGQHVTYGKIVGEPIDSSWLAERAWPLIRSNLWSTHGSWIEENMSAFSPNVAYTFENISKRVKGGSRANIQGLLLETSRFARKVRHFLSNGNILCFPTTVDLAPKHKDILNDFFVSREYYLRTMGVTAISGVSRTPEITIPLVEYDGVPIGLSFIGGYADDLLLMDVCDSLKNIMGTELD